MNRRSFLKSLTIVCGAAVVCPGELLKGEPEWMKYARTWDKLLKDKPEHIVIADLGEQRWPEYHNSYILNNKPMPFLVRELEKEFWNTKFKSPLMKRIR